MKNFLSFKFFRNDVFGGITAGIVALPLALAFGEQSGLGASAGLYGAAFIAFFAALFGGTSTQISGPTAPMTATSMLIIAGLIQDFEGDVARATPLILTVFLLAGIIQVGLGAIRIGTYIKYIPYPVISGFMTGIGVIIIITQLPLAFGYHADEDAHVVSDLKPLAEDMILERILKEEAEDDILVLENFLPTINAAQEVSQEEILLEAKSLANKKVKSTMGSLKAMPRAFKTFNKDKSTELILCLITIFIVYGFRKITKAVPSSLAALLVVSSGAYFMGLDYNLISSIEAGIPTPNFEIFSQFDFGMVAPYLMLAVGLALLGAIDSLLTSVVADNMTKTQHDPNRELIGQGIGNSVASLFGGLPGAGATIRTVVNIQAGGKTKLSGMIAGLLLFVIIVFLGDLASQIPAAVLVGILITVGIGVIDYKGLKAIPRMEISEVVILLSVFGITAFYDLVIAVGIGLILAAVVFFKRMSDLSEEEAEVYDLSHTEKAEPIWNDEASIPSDVKDKVLFKHLSGPMFFGFATHFKNLVTDIGSLHLVVIRMEKVPFMDQSGLYALEASIEDFHSNNVLVAISGPNDQLLKLMTDQKVIPKLLKEEYVFKSFDDCKVWLREVLDKPGKLEEKLKELS